MSKQKILYHDSGFITVFEKGFKKSSSSYLPGLYDVSTNQHMELVIQYEAEIKCQQPILTEELINFEKYLDLYLTNNDKFKEFNIARKLGLLLHGEPGTMKTSYCKYITNKLVTEHNAVVVQGTTFYAIENFYHFVRQYQDTLIVVMIDELDSFIDLSGDRDLLEFMDGVTPIDNVLFLGTTNNMVELPTSFLRPSRFKFVIECLPLSSVADGNILLKNMKVDPKLVDVKELVGKTIDEASEVIKDYIIGFKKVKSGKKKIGFSND